MSALRSSQVVGDSGNNYIKKMHFTSNKYKNACDARSISSQAQCVYIRMHVARLPENCIYISH